MTIDDRTREGLQRSMASIDVDAEHRLVDAWRRGRRRLVMRRAAVVLAVSAAVALVAVAGPGFRDLLRDRGDRPAAPPSVVPISGIYTTRVGEGDTTGTADASAVGRWLLTIDGNGTLDLASLTNGDLGHSVTQYQATQNEFLTTALTGSGCSGVGRYTWSRNGSTLTFAVVSDPCSLRVAIFSSHPWTSA